LTRSYKEILEYFSENEELNENQPKEVILMKERLKKAYEVISNFEVKIHTFLSLRKK
jgi:hypothetical protein